MFMNSNVTGKVFLVNASEGEKVAQARPHAFSRVGVNLSNAVAIIVASPFVDTMIDCDTLADNVVVSGPFVSIDGGPRQGESCHMLFERLAVGALDHPQTNLTAVTPHCPHHRGTIIVIKCCNSQDLI